MNILRISIAHTVTGNRSYGDFMVVMQPAYKEATNIGNVDKNRMIDDVSFRAFQNVY